VLSGDALLQEMDELKLADVDIDERLHISDASCLLLPYHEAIDKAREKKLGNKMIGTTGRGIGPAYEDKVARRAIRTGDLFYPEILKIKLEALSDYHNFLLENYYQAETLNWQKVYDALLSKAEKIKPLITDVGAKLDEYCKAGKKILFEGAQGTFLDVDYGTYPFVTSSNTTAASAATGSGLGPLVFDKVLGIVKAYTTRVGAGPFITELKDDIGKKIAERGYEFGSVTGRPRRCGWFDAVILRRAKQLNSLSALGLMKIDVLDGFEKIKVCVAYKHGERELLVSPTNIAELSACEPIYEELPGWTTPTHGIREFAKLPGNAKKYIKYLEEIAEIPINIISTGPERHDTIVLKNPFID
jgi:adenylosuccinate synthase